MSWRSPQTGQCEDTNNLCGWQKEIPFMSVAAKASGANTRAEIFSEPQCWKACFQALEKSQQINIIAKNFRRRREPFYRLWFELLYFTSCGGQLGTHHGETGPRHSRLRIAPLSRLGSERQTQDPADSGFTIGKIFGSRAGS